MKNLSIFSAIDLMKKMLAKDPTARITAHQALNHEWITTGGINASPSSNGPYYLSSAQENMKRFQEEYEKILRLTHNKFF